MLLLLRIGFTVELWLSLCLHEVHCDGRGSALLVLMNQLLRLNASPAAAIGQLMVLLRSRDSHRLIVETAIVRMLDQTRVRNLTGKVLIRRLGSKRCKLLRLLRLMLGLRWHRGRHLIELSLMLVQLLRRLDGLLVTKLKLLGLVESVLEHMVLVVLMHLRTSIKFMVH